MQIKPITGFPPALDETREEERRKKKQEERQKSDKPAAHTDANATATPAPNANASEAFSQISDSESLVKLLEHKSSGDAHKANPYRAKKS